MTASKAAPVVLRALVVSLTGCIALWGCVTTVRDLAVAGVSVTDSAEWFPPAAGVSKNEQTNRVLLRVDLTTEADLSEALLRREMLIHADVVFCSHPDDFALLGYSLFTTAPRAGERPRPLNNLHPVQYSEPPKIRTYYLPLNVALPARPSAIPPQVGFDLLSNPEDICISLRGASIPLTMKWYYVRSNTVRLSSDTIRDALSDARPTDRPDFTP